MRKLLDDGGLKLHLQDVKDPRREERLFLCFGVYYGELREVFLYRGWV